jgi:uncharacterized protein (DUF1697 family)
VDTYIALFRGINVSGKNILPMKDLVEILEGMGCEKVKTYIKSGNIVFRAKRNQTKKMAEEIGTKILGSHRFKPIVMLLRVSELEEAIENNPFRTEDGKVLHFFFLKSTPIKPDLGGLVKVKSNSEEFKLNKKTFYLYAPDGFGRSKLAARVEQALGIPVTARNWNTISKLIVMAKRA